VLVSAAITRLEQAWFEAYTSANSDDPIERTMYICEPMAEVEDFYGCILMNTSIELRGSNALATEAARDFKARLYAYFKQQVTLLRVKEPGVLAEQLVVLFDGTSAWIVMRRAFPSSTFHTLDMLLRSAEHGN
jgi:hypothetical protein